MSITAIATVGTMLAALIAAFASLINGRSLAKVKIQSQEIHVLVNSKMSEALKLIEQRDRRIALLLNKIGIIDQPIYEGQAEDASIVNTQLFNLPSDKSPI